MIGHEPIDRTHFQVFLNQILSSRDLKLMRCEFFFEIATLPFHWKFEIYLFQQPQKVVPRFLRSDESRTNGKSDVIADIRLEQDVNHLFHLFQRVRTFFDVDQRIGQLGTEPANFISHSVASIICMKITWWSSQHSERHLERRNFGRDSWNVPHPPVC